MTGKVEPGLLARLMLRTVALFTYIRNMARINYFRLAGFEIGANVTIERGVRLAGKVSIGDGTFIDRDANIRGNVRIGAKCHICVGVDMSGNVDIGENSMVGNYSTLSTMPDEGHVLIGNDVYVNSFSVIGSTFSVTIGNHCIFAPFVQITDAAHGIAELDVATKHAPVNGKPVVLGENIWLGSGVMVMMGVNIGKGAVIGAKSLVNSDIPAHAIAFGTPATVHRFRGSSES